MVDVSAKAVTERVAIAEGRVLMKLKTLDIAIWYCYVLDRLVLYCSHEFHDLLVHTMDKALRCEVIISNASFPP